MASMRPLEARSPDVDRANAALEREIGIPVLDSVAVTLWDCLRKAGVDPAPIDGAGRLFQSGMG